MRLVSYTKCCILQKPMKPTALLCASYYILLYMMKMVKWTLTHGQIF